MALNGRRRGAPGGASSSSSALPSSLASRSQSLPQLQQQHVNGTATPAPLANEYAGGVAATAKCRGEFCRVAPSALHGLYGRRRAGNGNNGNDPSEDADDNADDDDSTPRRRGLSRERDVVLEDDGRRFKIGNNNLLLAKAEMAFVTGAAAQSANDSGDVALQWQEADNVHRMELGRANPSAFYKQVSVCRNCHRIYADLAAFRDNGFQWHTSSKSAWTGTAAAHDAAKERNGGGVNKKKKADGGERQRGVVAKAALASPEDDATLEYDRLFLAELAKHSDSDELRPWQRQADFSARSETEVDAETRSVAPRATSSDALPVLGSTPSSTSTISKRKKPVEKFAPAPTQEDHSGNQHMGYPSGGRDNAANGQGSAVSRLELVISQLREQLATEQAAAKRVEAQRQLLEQKLAHNVVAMQEKEDEFRKKLLEVELESMSKKMNPSNSHQSTAPSSSSSANDVGELIETIDSLNRQLHDANIAADKLRRELMLSYQQETKRLHEKHQLEMESLRLSEYTAKEQTEAAHMQMNHWQNEAQVALSQAKSARAALDELTKGRLPQLEEKNQRLERQIAELRSKTSSAAASHQSNGPVQDIAAVEKHLNNKIDYLKAQLASEMKCKEELGSHLAGITASMEAHKKEKRTALADQEEAHKRHLERVEASFSQEKEVMNTQLASLQGKITTLQANVTDLVQELTMWKSKEANTKLALEKMAEENVRLTRQIVDLEGHVEVLQDERKRDGSMGVKNANDETQRMQMEALLRRLDNERQYLKSQVDNEAEQKVQCQRQVHSLEEELRELKVSTEEITRIAEQKISSLQTEKAHLERQLRDDKATFDDSKLMLTRQLKDMQVKFLQTREQSLIDKDEVEKARIELSEARSQLIAAREEAVKEKEYGKAANDRMSKALATIKSSLKTMEEEKNLRIQRLDDENRIYMQKLAKAQGDLLVLESKWSEGKQTNRRQQALVRVISLANLKLETHHIAAKASSFWQLRSVSIISKLRETLIAAHNHDMSEREKELNQEFAHRCDELTQSLHSERVEALNHANALHEREKEELQQYYQQERSQLEEDLQHIRTRQMRELEEQYEETLKSVDEQSAAALSALQARCDELEQERNEARNAAGEMQKRCEQFGATFETHQKANTAELLERQKRWEQEMESMINEHTQQLQKVREETSKQLREQDEAHATALAGALRAAEELHMDAMDRLRADMERVKSETTERMKNEHVLELQALQDQHVMEIEHEKQQLMESLQRELDQERLKHEKALKSALERVESKTQGHLESLQKNMNDRKANALLQCTAKWQKAMEDLQARFDVEKKIAYESGLQDRENEWQQAALQIKQKQKEELESVQNEAVRAIQAAEERHRMLLEAQTTLMRKELKEKQQLEIEVLRVQIVEAEKANSQRELEKALQEQESSLRSLLDHELGNLRDELNDDHSADVKGLQEKWLHEKRELIEAHHQAHQAAVREWEEIWTDKLNQLRVEKESEMSSRLSDQEQALSKQFETIRLEMQDAFSVELELKLKKQEERLLNEQEEAINQVQEDSERLIEQVEVAMSELKKQKEALENELTRLRSALEEAEDAHFDAEENMKKQQKSVAFQLMALIMHAKKTIAEGSQAYTRQLLELQGKHDHLDATLHREKRQWERDLAQIRESWTQLQSRHSDMLQTLTNYKRDELVAHRSASAVLSNEVTIVVKQMDEVTEMKLALEKEIEQLQGEAHNVEASLRQLMLQSSSSSSSLSGGSDGSLNMAMVAKKRRLNEEFEALLEQVERKKSEVRNIDKTLGSLRQRREEKESELKVMERKLVEILVGQQKQMLTLLNAAREVALPAAIAATATAS